MNAMERYETRPGVVLTNICGEYMLLAAKAAREYCPYMTQLNESSAFLWRLLESGADLGLIFDTDNRVQLVVDKDLLDAPYMGMVPASRTKSLRMLPSDWLEKVVPAMHHDPIIIGIEGENYNPEA